MLMVWLRVWLRVWLLCAYMAIANNCVAAVALLLNPK